MAPYTLEGLDQRRQQDHAFIGQRQSLGDATEEAFAQPLLQVSHVLADGGLREMQLLRRASEAEMTGRDLEGS